MLRYFKLIITALLITAVILIPVQVSGSTLPNSEPAYSAKTSISPPATTTKPEIANTAIEILPNLAEVSFMCTLSSLGSASQVEVYFEWGETTSYGKITESQFVTSTGLVYTSLIKIPQDTIFSHFRAIATGDGTAISEDQTFHLPAVVTAGYANVQNTSVTLHGDINDFNWVDHPEVTFEYGTDMNYGKTAQPTYRDGGPFQVDIQGLIPGTTYHFRAKASVPVNHLYYGMDMEFTTLPLETRATQGGSKMTNNTDPPPTTASYSREISLLTFLIWIVLSISASGWSLTK